MRPSKAICAPVGRRVVGSMRLAHGQVTFCFFLKSLRSHRRSVRIFSRIFHGAHHISMRQVKRRETEAHRIGCTEIADDAMGRSTPASAHSHFRSGTRSGCRALLRIARTCQHQFRTARLHFAQEELAQGHRLAAQHVHVHVVKDVERRVEGRQGQGPAAFRRACGRCRCPGDSRDRRRTAPHVPSSRSTAAGHDPGAPAPHRERPERRGPAVQIFVAAAGRLKSAFAPARSHRQGPGRNAPDPRPRGRRPHGPLPSALSCRAGGPVL